MPRHPPYALIRLTYCTCHISMTGPPLTILRMYHQCLFSTFVSSLAKKLSFSICSVGNCFYLLQKNFSIIHCVVFKEPCPAPEARFSAQMAGYGLDLFSPILLREKAPSKLNSRIISSRRRFCSSWLLLRKEVIQPHLPIRLPCYDFTPIIDPTFDSSLLCRLGHRLRVLSTFVV